MAARLVSSVNLRDAARSAAIAVPDVSPTTYDWYPWVQRFEVRDLIGDFGRDPSESSVELVPGSEPVVASPVYFKKRRVVRINYDDGSFEEFRVVRFDRDLSGESPPRLALHPIWLDLAAEPSKRVFGDGMVTYTWYRLGVSVSDALSAIMEDAPAHFAAGTVDASFSGVTVTVIASSSTHLELLRTLCAEVQRKTGTTCEWDIRWDSGAGEYKIDLVPFVGGTIDQPIEGPTAGGAASEANRQRMTRTIDAQLYFSRVVGLAGPEGEQVTVAQATWPVSGASYSAPNTTLTLDQDPIYVTNTPGNSGIEFGNASDGWFTVVSTAVPNEVVVSGDASALNGTDCRFRLATGDDLTYLSDPAAETDSEVVVRVLERSDIPPAKNLLEENGITADFSSWSGGSPVGWNTSGCSVSEETDARYVQAGSKSARVSGGAGGVFYSDNMTVTPTAAAPYLSTWIAVRVLSGRIRLEVEDVSSGYQYPLNNKDAADAKGDVVRALAIGGLTPLSGSHRVRITCMESSTVFVVDSATLTQSPVPFEYTPDMGPEALWHACGALLALEGGDQPDQYEGEWFDVSYLDSATEDESTIGAKVQYKDAEAGGSFTIDVESRLVELVRQHAGQNYVKRGRLGSKAIDVTAFLDERQKRRVLTTQESPSMRAEFEGLEIGFDGNGYVLLSWNGNGPFLKGYATIGIDSTPSDPSSSSNDGTLTNRKGSLKFDGSGGTNSKQAAMGQLVHVKAVAENTLGIVTSDYVVERKRRRGDTQKIRPTGQVQATRSGDTVTVTLDVKDPTLAVTAIEYRKQDSGGSLDGSWQTGWTSSTGTAGASTSLQRTKQVTSEDGLDAQLLWRVTYTDENGNSQTIGDTIDLAKLKEISDSRRIPLRSGMPFSSDVTWTWLNGYLSPNSVGDVEDFVVDLELAHGIALTQAKARVYRAGGSDTAALYVHRIGNTGSLTILGSMVHTGSGWGDVTATLSETVDTVNYGYQALIQLRNNSSLLDARALWLDIAFNRPDYTKTL